MNTDAGSENIKEEIRPRRRFTRLTPAGRPGLVEEEASATSQKAVDQSQPEKNDVSPDPEVKSRKAVRGRTTTGAWSGRLKYYGLALVLVASAVLMRMVLTRLVGPGMPTYITFFPFVMLAALIGGLGPGLLATLTTAVVVSYWLLLPPGTFTIERSVDAVGLAFFCVMGILVSLVAELYRRTRDHLDELVSVRTAALRVANARLQRQSEEVQSQAEALQLETQKLTATEATLRRSESHLAQAQQIAGVGSWSWDIGTDRLYWSDEMYRLYGLQPRECAARQSDFLRFVHPEDRQRIETFAREALVRRHYSTDYRIIRTDGEERHVHSEGETTFDDQGDPVKAEGILQDITERKRTEEVLKVKDSAIASSLNAIAMADLQGCLTYINPAFLRLWGYENEREVLGRSVLDFWEEPQRAQEVVQAIQTRGGWTGELVGVRKDGTHLDLYLSASTVFNEEGTPICMMGAFMDVTARKRAEEALRQAKTFTDKLLNAPLDTVFLFEPSTGQPVRWNKRFAEVSGYSDEEIAGMKAPDDFYDADDLKKAQESTRRTLADGQGVVELSLITKRGVHIPFEYAGTVVEDEEGKTLLLCVGRDITARKQAEEELRKLTATLESKVMQRTAELSHRARQLQKLTLEMSEAEDRERKRLAAILHDDVQQIIAAARFHLGVMKDRTKDDASLAATGEQIDQMLKEAVEKSRGLSHELSPAALYEDFAQALGQLASQMQAKHGLVVEVHATGPVHLQSDAVRAFIYRTAQELLFNAVKHAQVKEVRIHVRRLGRCLCLAVSDRGRGFDPQDLREAAGFGLLSIQERIGLLGGRMKIKSAQGKGSKFFLIVPDGETAAVE